MIRNCKYLWDLIWLSHLCPMSHMPWRHCTVQLSPHGLMVHHWMQRMLLNALCQQYITATSTQSELITSGSPHTGSWKQMLYATVKTVQAMLQWLEIIKSGSCKSMGNDQHCKGTMKHPRPPDPHQWRNVFGQQLCSCLSSHFRVRCKYPFLQVMKKQDASLEQDAALKTKRKSNFTSSCSPNFSMLIKNFFQQAWNTTEPGVPGKVWPRTVLPLSLG